MPRYEDIESGKIYEIIVKTTATNGGQYYWSAKGTLYKGTQPGGRIYYSLVMCPHTHILCLFPDRDELLEIDSSE